MDLTIKLRFFRLAVFFYLLRITLFPLINLYIFLIHLKLNKYCEYIQREIIHKINRFNLDIDKQDLCVSVFI